MSKFLLVALITITFAVPAFGYYYKTTATDDRSYASLRSMMLAKRRTIPLVLLGNCDCYLCGEKCMRRVLASRAAEKVRNQLPLAD